MRIDGSPATLPVFRNVLRPDRQSFNISCLQRDAFRQGFSISCLQRGALTLDGSGDLLHGAGTDAPAAGLYFLDRAVPYGLNALKIGVPSSFCLIVGMAYVVAENRALSAYVTCGCHVSKPPAC
jgi:hypothetical protein